MKEFRRILCASLAVLTLTGCTDLDATRSDITDVSVRADEALADVTPTRGISSPLIEEETPWFGAMAIPADLREAARSYHSPLGQRFRTLYLPALFPYLVTGWVTAAGGAWNASIVAEFVTFRGETLLAEGLGARISLATQQEEYHLLAACTLVMAIVVVAFNRTVWRYCYRLAERKYSLNK